MIKMGCLKCGSPYMEVVGKERKELRCSRCGHIQKTVGDTMLDDADLIEQAELDIWSIIQKLHKAGVRYEVVHQIFVEIVKTLEIQGYAEQWLQQNDVTKS